MNRKSQNQLISEIFTIDEFLKIENIKIEYENDYIYSKNFDIEKMITYPNLFSEKTFQNGQISITHEENTFFDTTLIYITKPNLKINNKSIISPFYIGPNAIPFNKEITLSISLFDNKNIEHCIISKYSKEKKQWIPLKTSVSQKTLTTKIRQGSIIGVLVDNEKPKINNIIPRNGATYLLNYING